MHFHSATHNDGQEAAMLARQGLRLPQIVLRQLRVAGRYCQPAVSVGHQNLAKKYLEEDTHLLSHDSSHYRVPRFLLNDIVRFWRTMAVDFASKQRDREGSGWGLRNAKLRMSRKLIFASGMLVCFSASLDPELKKRISTMKSTDDDAIRSNLANHLKNFVMLTPLEVLEKSVRSCGVSENVARDLFGAYGEFLTILGNEKARKDLADLRARDSRTDATFKQVRKISEMFEKALNAMFFENPILAPLTRKYGVF